MEEPVGTFLEDNALFRLRHCVGEEDCCFCIVFEPWIGEKGAEAIGVSVVSGGIVREDVEGHDLEDCVVTFQLHGIWITVFEWYI